MPGKILRPEFGRSFDRRQVLLLDTGDEEDIVGR